ncbi:MAG TPA: ABC transporter permease [Vicinamibacterales bacterium]|jgi:predicted permease
MSVLRGLKSDLELSLRRLLHEPAFTLVCVATLAIGIGGNTAVFTLIDRVMLEQLPVHRPSELYRLGDNNTCCVNSGLPGQFSLFSYDLYRHLKDNAPQFTELAAFAASSGGQVAVGPPDGQSPPAAFSSTFVSGNYFQMFGLQPAVGRLLQTSDDQPGATTVAVISHRLWRDRYRSTPNIAGTQVLLNGVPGVIVGVAPEKFYGEMIRPLPPDFWIPISNEPLLQPQARLVDAKASHWLYIIGRLPRGTDVGALDAQLTAHLQNWIRAALNVPAEERERIPQQTIRLASAARGVNNMRNGVAPSLRILQSIAAAVLLIACANLANLLLGRGAARRTETAVRVALGAPRGRLIRQQLIESAVLACVGGVVGLLIAYAGARAIVLMTFRGAPDVPIDPTPSLLVLAFAFVISLVTAAAFGAAPAILGSRSDPIDALRGSARTTAERATRLRQALIAIQIAVSLVLVACAGLLGRSLINLQQQNFGFSTDRRYVAYLANALGGATSEELASVYGRLRERLARIPGVEQSALALYSPMSNDNWSSPIIIEGRSAAESRNPSWSRITPGYFEATGTDLLRGRAIDERDRPGTLAVAVVNETFVKTYFPDADPIGKRFSFTGGRLAYEVVGIVRDVKYQNARRAVNPMFFLPFLQQAPPKPGDQSPVLPDRSHYPRNLVIHARTSAATLDRDVRAALGEVDRRVTVRMMMTMDEQVARNFNMDRVIARLTVVFGAIALLLACLGLYGVTAYWVARRTREIGIRVAIGATRGRVLGTVLRGALWQLGVGLAIGVPAAIGAGRLLQSQLYEVSGRDVVVLSGGVIVLALCGVAAALIPARRAASLDPISALRNE